MSLLEIDNITKRFRGVVAIDGVTLKVHAGEMVSLIGPNGAGKSTLFNCISGLERPDAGAISFDGRLLDKLIPSDRALLGLGRTFQTPQLFEELTLLENLAVAAQSQNEFAVVDHLVGLGRKLNRMAIEVARDVAQFCALPSLGRYPSDLSLREQRILEVARSLCLAPKLLLLDEPASGMDPDETDAFARLLMKIRRRAKLAMLYVEHDMRLVMGVSDFIYVLDFGRCIDSGTPAQISASKEVRNAYLGEEAAANA